MRPIISSIDPVIVIWLDAETVGDGGWMPVKQLEKTLEEDLPTVISIGFIVEETKTYIAIADTVANDCVGVVNKIPWGMITSIERLAICGKKKTKNNKGRKRRRYGSRRKKSS